MQTRYIYLLKYILLITDLIMVNTVYFLAYFFSFYQKETISPDLNLDLIIACNLIWLLCTSYFGLYTDSKATNLERIYNATWKSLLAHFLFFTCAFLIFKSYNFTDSFLLIFYVFFGALFLLSRLIGSSFQSVLFTRFSAVKSIAILGKNKTADKLAKFIDEQDHLAFEGFLDDYELNELVLDQRELWMRQLEMAAENGIKNIYAVIEPSRTSDMSMLSYEADRLCLSLKFIPDVNINVLPAYKFNYLSDELPSKAFQPAPFWCFDVNKSSKNRIKARTLWRMRNQRAIKNAIASSITWSKPVRAKI